MTATDPQPLPESGGPAPGQRLAEARKAQNLSPADIARQLKLSVSQVEALEAGDYRQLPGAIFVRGFIRNYARLVKLDPDELLRTAGETLPQPAPRSEKPPSPDIPFPAKQRRVWPIAAAALLVVVGILVAYEFYWTDAGPVTEPEPKTAAPQAARPAVEPAPSVATSRELPSVPEQAKTAMPASTGESEGKNRVEPPRETVAQAEPERQPRRGERQVKLEFDQECWVEIRDRNEKIIFSQLNRPGTQQSVTGMPPFSVVLGNAHGVRLLYDDKPVDLAPHTKIDVARLILQ